MKRSTGLLVSFSTAMFFGQPSGAADVTYDYLEDFESGAPVVEQPSGATVHDKGISTVRATSGTQSYFVDVEFDDEATATQPQGVTFRIPVGNMAQRIPSGTWLPAAGELTLSARAWIEYQDSVPGEEPKGYFQLGFRTHSLKTAEPKESAPVLGGLRTPGVWKKAEVRRLVPIAKIFHQDRFDRKTDDRRIAWKTTEAELGTHIPFLELRVTGWEGERIKVWIDDVRVQGEAPSQADYAYATDQLWGGHTALVGNLLGEFAGQLADAEARVAALAGQSLDPFETSLLAEVEAHLGAVDLGSAAENGYLLEDDRQELRYHLSNALDELDVIEGAGPATRVDHLLYQVPMTRDIRRATPVTGYVPGTVVNDDLQVKAAGGEYESLFFSVAAPRVALEDVLVEISDLESPGKHVLPASEMDLYLVKSWWQGGELEWLEMKIDRDGDWNEGRWLVPELLLKDPDLVHVAGDQNLLRKLDQTYANVTTNVKATCHRCSFDAALADDDASVLLPVDIAQGEAQLFMARVHVPEGQLGGTYSGALRVLSVTDPESPTVLGEYGFEVDVLGLDLPEPDKTYSLMYTAEFNPEHNPDQVNMLGHKDKSPEQMKREFEDMKAHGVATPQINQAVSTNYNNLDDTSYFEAYMDLFQAVFCIDRQDEDTCLELPPVFANAHGVDPENRDNAWRLEGVGGPSIIGLYGMFGATDLHLGGSDEPNNEKIVSQWELYQALKDVGLGTFSAADNGQLEFEYHDAILGNYRFEDGGGTAVADAPGEPDWTDRENPGALVGSATAVAGKVGAALEFAGAGYVDMGDVMDIAPDLEGYTICGWVRSDASGHTTAYENAIAFKVGGQRGFALTMPNGQLYLSVAGSGGAQSGFAGTPGDFNDGVWHFVAVTMEFGSANEARIYVDGNEVGDPLDLSGVGEIHNAGSFTLGGYELYGGTYLFDGALDEIKVYGRTLSAEELEHHRQDGLAASRTLVGDLKDLNITHGDTWFPNWDPAEVELLHGWGGEIFAYSLPQGGYEDPEMYRRNYGHMLWKYDYDGAMTYAYQRANGFIWDESDDGVKDLVMAYPTHDGLVGTVQWEGFREAVDDTRYRVALEQTLDAYPAHPDHDDAQSYLATLKTSDIDRTDDLDGIRAAMLGYIRAIRPSAPPENLSAESTGAITALAWEAPASGPAVGSYRIWRNGVEIAETADLAFYDSDPYPIRLPSTLYTYSVRAVFAEGEISDEAVATATSGWDLEPPTAPGNLTAENLVNGTVNVLEWDPSTDNSVVALYLVYRDGVFRTFASAAYPFFLDYAIEDAVTYEYQVFAWDDSYNLSPGSNTAEVTVEQ